jgi:hypothetical protein
VTTHELIQAALQAQADFDTAQSTLQTATAAMQAAQAALQSANQALHDDLAANGPAVIVDDTTMPATVTMYTAVDPDSWHATNIRVA